MSVARLTDTLLLLFLLPMSFPLVPRENRVKPEVLQGSCGYPSLCMSCHSLFTLLCHSGLLDALCHSGRFPPTAPAALLAWKVLPQMATGLTRFLRRSLFRWHTRKSVDLPESEMLLPPPLCLSPPAFIFLNGVYHLLQCYMFVCSVCHSSIV